MSGASSLEDVRCEEKVVVMKCLHAYFFLLIGLLQVFTTPFNPMEI